MIRIAFLGTGAAVPTTERGNTSLAISTETQTLLFDCGGEVYRGLLKAKIDPRTLTDLVLTHAHIDHLVGFPSLLECLRLSGHQTPLRVWGLPHTLDIAERLLDVFSFELQRALPYGLDIRPVVPEEDLEPLGSLEIAFTAAFHSVPAIASRVTVPPASGHDRARIIVYSSDTRFAAGLETFAQGCDLLILECTYLDDHKETAQRVGHLTAGQTGQLARAAQARRLALVHLGVADGWSVDDARREAQAAFSGPVLIPNDHEVIEL
jgi:ribonuclease Z